MPNLIVIMDQKRDFTLHEKSTIVSKLGKGKTTLEISKILGRNHWTMNKFVQSLISIWSRANKGRSKVALNHSLSYGKREVVQNLCLTSREVFKYCGREDILQPTRCRPLKQVDRNVKPVTKTSLKAVHKRKRLKWEEEYIKIDFFRQFCSLKNTVSCLMDQMTEVKVGYQSVWTILNTWDVNRREIELSVRLVLFVVWRLSYKMS